MGKKKKRGHYCRICNRSKANEAFSGKGHRDHICRSCGRIPKKDIKAIIQRDEIFGYLKQSHISGKNVKRLQELRESPDEQTAELAEIVLEVAEVKPYKRRRLKVLARKRPDLLQKLDETGLIFVHHFH